MENEKTKVSAENVACKRYELKDLEKRVLVFMIIK